MPVYTLDDSLDFPPVSKAEEGGLLAIGGDLSVTRLLAAYHSGIFPWFNEGDPLLWWSPEIRCVIRSSAFNCPRSTRKIIRAGRYGLTVNRDFAGVIEACRSVPRAGQNDTWITQDMVNAYIALHEAGWAHSIETWKNGQLVGGLYGVCVGRCFCGESMFSRESDSSKVALAGLVSLFGEEEGLIDCQMPTPHLMQFGAEEMTRENFVDLLGRMSERPAIDLSPRKLRLR